jgi:hypothetical protein
MVTEDEGRHRGLVPLGPRIAAPYGKPGRPARLVPTRNCERPPDPDAYAYTPEGVSFQFTRSRYAVLAFG